MLICLYQMGRLSLHFCTIRLIYDGKRILISLKKNHFIICIEANGIEWHVSTVVFEYKFCTKLCTITFYYSCICTPNFIRKNLFYFPCIKTFSLSALITLTLGKHENYRTFGKPHTRYFTEWEERHVTSKMGFCGGHARFSKIMPEAFECVRGCYLDIKLNNLKCSWKYYIRS